MILDKIITRKKSEVAQAKEEISPEQMRELAANDLVTRITRPFLKEKISQHPIELIAEIKKASPSRGLIRDFNDPAEIARIYENNGAAAISVLTDETFFRGHPSYLRKAREAVNLPVLRKDFIIDAYQIYQSRVLGADVILLIAAALEANQLQDFQELAGELQLQVLVEVHTEEELEVVLETLALVDIPAVNIGINNRDLRTFVTDIDTTLRLRDKIKDPGIKVVSESGIKTAEDIELLARHGVDAVLIGESLMAAADPGLKIQELFGGSVQGTENAQESIETVRETRSACGGGPDNAS